jgi:(p)ppGpp synthase/HD superfamily hydrolase
MLGKAIAIAAEAFETKKDKGGYPYILHCLYVMNGVKALGEEAQIAAVLHDLIEDTKWTATDLLDEGFNTHTVDIIVMLTHKPNEPYDDYVKRVSMNRIARKIKMVDLQHNSNITRMKGLRDKDFKRLEKYHRAYAYLNEVED